MVLALVGFGFEYARIQETPTEDRLRDELSRVRTELLMVQSEYAAYRGRNPEAKAQGSPIASPPSPAQPTASSPGPVSAQDNIEDKTIGAGSTQTFFGGSVSISVLGISFEGDPLRNKVTAVVGSPGLPNQKVDRQDVGYVMRFKARDTYEIRVVRAQTFDAEFRVGRIQP